MKYLSRIAMAWLCVMGIAFCAVAEESSVISLSDYVSDDALSKLDGVRKVIYQDSQPEVNDAQVDGYTIAFLNNSHALTGRGCSVNGLLTQVDVASAYIDMENLIDDDLDNYCTIGKGVAASATINPVVRVVDTNHYYAKGTKAGFCVLNTNNSLLTLDVIKAMGISFYRDGEFIATVDCKEGQNASGLTLSLINVAGQGGILMLTAEAPDAFDEIGLTPSGGLDLSAAVDMNVKYAFVGEPRRHIMNDDYTTGLDPHKVDHIGGITTYNQLTGRNIKLDFADVNGDHLATNYKNLIGNPDEGALVQLVLGVGGYHAELHLSDTDNPGQEVFKKGTEVGFKLGSGSLLNLSIGSGAYIAFYGVEPDKQVLGFPEYTTELARVTLDAGVLDLSVASGSEQYLSCVAPCDFSGFKVFVATGLTVDLGGKMIYYGYIKEPPTQTHYCDLGSYEHIYLSNSTTSFEVPYNKEIGETVGMELLSKPEGSYAYISDGVLTDIDLPGAYEVRMYIEERDADGNLLEEGNVHKQCEATVYIHYKEFAEEGGDTTSLCVTPMFNDDSSAPEYVLTDEIYESEGSGSLISATDRIDFENILNPDQDKYGTLTQGFKLASNIRIVGVKKINGPICDGYEPKSVGFVVEETSDGLNVKALQFLQIRCYNDGEKVFEAPITESHAISAQVIGSNRSQKALWGIKVPEGMVFNEIQLWTSGVLDIDASSYKIYYPYVSEPENDCTSLLGCNGEMIHTTATAVPMQAGGINVAQGVENVRYLIDPSYETAMRIFNTVQAGAGVIIRVDFGHMIHDSNNIGLIMDSDSFLAGVKAGNWLTVRLYNTTKTAAEDTPAEVSRRADAEVSRRADAEVSRRADAEDPTLIQEVSDWHVVNANVAGTDAKRAVYITPKEPFNKMEIEVAGIVGLANNTQDFYGICTRGDANKDGIPDCMQPANNFVVNSVETVRETINNNLMVTLAGRTATASCPGAAISRLLVYDLDGHAVDAVDGEDQEVASIRLNPGICILQIIFADGSSRSVKLFVR